MQHLRPALRAGLALSLLVLAACGGGASTVPAASPAAVPGAADAMRTVRDSASPSYTATFQGYISQSAVNLYPTPCGHIPAVFAPGGAAITGGPLQAGQTVTVYGTLRDQHGNAVPTGCPDRIDGVTAIVVGGASASPPPPGATPPPPATGGAHVPTVVEHPPLDGVPAVQAAAAIDYVFAPTDADADHWRAAGIKTIGYVDAAVQYDPPDYSPFLTGDESTYLHACGGSRARFSAGGLGGSFMDLGAPSYQALVGAAVSQRAPHDDAFLFDDALSAAMLYGSSVSPPCDTWVGFDYRNSAAVASAKLAALLSAAFAGTTTFLNGLGLAPDDGTPWAAMQATLQDPTVAGGMYEFCYLGQTDHTVANKRTEIGWQSVLASQVDAAQRGRKFWCLALTGDDGDSDAGRDQRLYAYASFLLGFDGQALFEETFAESHGLPVYPETSLVPSDPQDPAGSNPRRFGSCAVGGQGIGPCAVFVNPSASHGASVPAGYGAAIQLVGGSVFEGGSLASTGVPATLGPAEAVILTQAGVLPSSAARRTQAVRRGTPVIEPLPGRLGQSRLR